MTAKEQKLAAKLADELEALMPKIADIHRQAEEIRDSAREAYDAKSEKWQEGDKGQEASAACDALDTACTEMESIIQSGEEACTELRNSIVTS